MINFIKKHKNEILIATTLAVVIYQFREIRAMKVGIKNWNEWESGIIDMIRKGATFELNEETREIIPTLRKIS